MSVDVVYAKFFRATAVAAVALANLVAGVAPLAAQTAPSLVDPNLRLERPALSGVRAIRFLTTDDYPPLNFAAADGSLTGFNVDVARAVCKTLAIGCTIQTRPFETLIDALTSGKGDAAIASIAPSEALRSRIDFTFPYYRTPARFIVRRDAARFPATPAGLAGRTVGVVAGTAHQAFLELFFPKAVAKPFATPADLEQALQSNAVPVAFADGVTFSIWLNGEGASNCCEFSGGPYLESRFFGEGVGIAVRRDDSELREALNWALAKMAKDGTYAELYLKYFPVSFY